METRWRRRHVSAGFNCHVLLFPGVVGRSQYDQEVNVRRWASIYQSIFISVWLPSKLACVPNKAGRKKDEGGWGRDARGTGWEGRPSFFPSPFGAPASAPVSPLPPFLSTSQGTFWSQQALRLINPYNAPIVRCGPLTQITTNGTSVWLGWTCVSRATSRP